MLDKLTHRAGFAYHFTATGPLGKACAAAFNGLDARGDVSAWLNRVAELRIDVSARLTLALQRRHRRCSAH